MLLVATVAAGILGVNEPARPAQAATRPNVLIVITDDQRWDKVTSKYMPQVESWLGGSFFSQGIVPNSLCCPSRTSILTGNYSHTTGVWDNGGPYGGFEAFDDKHTIAVDFHQAGYRTAMIGKYLNGYSPKTERYVPPGWDRWFGMRTGAYYDYWAVSRRGEGQPVRNRHYGKHPGDYATNVIRDQALNFIDSGDQPFFMYLSWTAPHGQAIPAPNDESRFAGDPDFGFARKKSSMLEAAYGADRATGRILGAVPDNTIVVFLSDNGYLWGEHGLTGKMQPYEEATRVPFAIKSLDGSWSPTAGLDDIVSNVDLRPTLTSAAGVPMLTHADGLDLGADTYVPRDEVVLEHRNDLYSYCGVRTNGWMYARFDDGRQLLFDLSTDYAEENNLVDANPDELAELKARAKDLCDPLPPGYVW